MSGISIKELLELSDRLVSHQCLAEKLGHYVAQTDDEELRHVLSRHQQVVLRQCREMASALHGFQRQSGWGAYYRLDDVHAGSGVPWQVGEGVH